MRRTFSCKQGGLGHVVFKVTEDNVPAAARPSNKNLAVDFKDEDKLQLVAEIMSG
ncbi:hypothetical protein ABBQ38_007210 [Trebouxia sp. C0009 RCD-2024]